jgi:outer membrane lipoprotein-sorting protein
MRDILKRIGHRAATVLALACFILLSAFVPASGAEQETTNPAKSMLEKASLALGENKTWTTRVEKGLFIEWDTEGWGTLRADYTRSISKPDKMKIDQDNSAYDHPFFRTYYYSGGDAWAMVNLTVRQSPQITANLKTVIEKADGIAYYLARCDTFLAPSPVPGDSLLSGNGLERAGCVLNGDSVLFDINSTTGLLARRIENKGKRAYIFEDYRNVQGHNMPFHITVYDGGKKSSEFQWKAITFDEKLDDSIFEENRPPKQ